MTSQAEGEEPEEETQFKEDMAKVSLADREASFDLQLFFNAMKMNVAYRTL